MKKKEYDETDTSAEAVLSKIKNTNGIADKIRKGMGIKLKDAVPDNADDMYEYSYKQPDLEHIGYLIVHGKCFEAGTSGLRSWGYEFVQEKHFPKDDKTYVGVKCTGCGELMNEKLNRLRTKDMLEKCQEEREAFEEWRTEQVLLGKL